MEGVSGLVRDMWDKFCEFVYAMLFGAAVGFLLAYLLGGGFT